MLGAGGAQQLRALAVEEDDRAQVDVELEIDPLGGDLGDGGADADAGVVDQHVQAPPALAVRRDDALDVVLVGHVAGDLLDLEAVVAQCGDRVGELLRPARGDGQPVALLAQHARDREADPARGSGDEGGAIRHLRGPF